MRRTSPASKAVCIVPQRYNQELKQHTKSALESCLKAALDDARRPSYDGATKMPLQDQISHATSLHPEHFLS